MKTYHKHIAGVAIVTLLFLLPGSSAVAGVPLQVLSFSAQQSNKDVLIDWKTGNEGATNYFEVERSENALVFVPIGRLSACNTAGFHNYRVTDAHPEGTNKTLYYRLKQVDLDGNITYIPIIRLTFGQTNTVSLFPNPVSRQSTLQVTLVRPGRLTVQITDYMGRPIRQCCYQLEDGTTSLPFDAAGLACGVYYAEVRGAVFARLIRFVKQ
jgi:hypothetical protein